MYSGFSKDSGAVIGVIGPETHSLDLADAQDTAGAEESLLGVDPEGREIAVVAQIDPSSGDLEWVPTYDVDFIKSKTVAMSQMGSMLRDKDRNNVYEQALQRMISVFTTQTQRAPVVLDIGAGTGLLSLLSARSGAAVVYGLEMFDSMASIAQNVVEANKLSERIIILNDKSTAIDQLPVQADILVTEVLDSALLGESILPTHTDALARLVRKDGPIPPQTDRVIPNRAEVFCSLAESWELQARVSVDGIKCGKETFIAFRDQYAQDCPGASAALPVHWEALEHRGARVLSQPTLCMKASFCQERVVQEQELSVWESEMLATSAGTVTALLVWWKTYLLPLSLDLSQQVFYSTQPGAQNWQDHWQQVAFPLRKPIVTQPGQTFRVTLVHDEIGMWAFAEPIEEAERSVTGVKRSISGGEPRVRSAVPRPGDEKFLRPSCTCGWHLLCSPHRIQMVADAAYNAAWGAAVEQAVAQNAARTEKLLVLDLSDGAHLAIMAGLAIKRLGCQLQCPAVVSRERKDFSRLFYHQMIAANNLEDLLMLWDGQQLESILEYFNDDEMTEGSSSAGGAVLPTLQVGVLMSDLCYYQMHSRPTWPALSFYYQRRAWAELLHPEATIVPARAHICVALVELCDLHISHGLVGHVSGFDHAPLDAVQVNWHEFLYPYYLANYRKRVLSRPVRLAVLDYYTLSEQFDSILQQVAVVEQAGRLDCLAIWVDYDVDREGCHCLQHFDGQEFVSHSAQSLKFLPSPRTVQAGEQVGVAMALPQGSSEFQFGVF